MYSYLIYPTPGPTTDPDYPEPAATPTATHAPPPAGPVLTAAVQASAVELGWTAVQDATRYELWAWDSINGWMQIGGSSLTGTNYSHADVTAGTTYCYTILAVDAAGEPSDWSPYVSTTVSASSTA